mgnify:CR=1 FL=1
MPGLYQRIFKANQQASQNLQYKDKDEDGNFKEIEIDSEKPVLICVPNGLASAHVNVGKEQARILVLADIAWRPNDNEMINVEFSDYDFNKWK